MTKAKFLEGKNVYLRPLEIDDLDKFYKWVNDPNIRKYLLLFYPITREQEKEKIEELAKDENNVMLSIVIKKNDKLIGNIALMKIDKIHRSADLGIAVFDLASTSKGYGTEALKLMIDYGFKTLNLHRIELFVFDFNTRAMKAYKKVGFVEEGRERESFYLDGTYHDTIVMSILKHEWMKKK